MENNKDYSECLKNFVYVPDLAGQNLPFYLISKRNK